jgi:hypothetical protein
MREPFVHRRLSQFVDSHRCLCMLLIFRATNLRDQEVGGSNPLAPTLLSPALMLTYTATACCSSTQYQDPMWPRRHTHRSPMFVEIFGHWWHAQRHASNHSITLANSGWIPAR